MLQLSEDLVRRFDYAQWIRSIVTNEISSLLEVNPSTWGIFLILVWIVSAVRAAAGWRYDNSTTTLGVSVGWGFLVIVLALVIDAHQGLVRLHHDVAACFLLKSPKKNASIEEIFETMYDEELFSDSSQRNPVEEIDATQKSRQERKSITCSDSASKIMEIAASTDKEAIELVVKDSKEEGESKSTQRRILKTFSQSHFSRSLKKLDSTKFQQLQNENKHLRCHPKYMSLISEVIMFLQCFMIGLLVLVNLFDSSNLTKHYGKLIYNSSSISSISYGRRATAPTMESAAWAKCEDFAARKSDATISASFTTVQYIGQDPFTVSGAVYSCRIYPPWYGPFSMIMALIPQVIIMFLLQPMLIKNYCYIAAVTMGKYDKHTRRKFHIKEDDAGANLSSDFHDNFDNDGHGKEGRFSHAALEHILHDVYEKMHSDADTRSLLRNTLNKVMKTKAVDQKRNDIRKAKGLTEASKRSRAKSWAAVDALSDADVISRCTEEMFERARHHIFAIMDGNGDGGISYRELKQGLTALLSSCGAARLPDRKFRRLVRFLDPDHTGTILESTFHTFFTEEHFDWPKEEDKLTILEVENEKLRLTISSLQAKLEKCSGEKLEMDRQDSIVPLTALHVSEMENTSENSDFDASRNMSSASDSATAHSTSAISKTDINAPAEEQLPSAPVEL